jgi:hypothetical protein
VAFRAATLAAMLGAAAPAAAGETPMTLPSCGAAEPEEVFLPQPLASRGLSTLAPRPRSGRQRRPAVSPCQLQSAEATLGPLGAFGITMPSCRLNRYSLNAQTKPPSIVSGEGRPKWVRVQYCKRLCRHEVRAILEFRS